MTLRIIDLEGIDIYTLHATEDYFLEQVGQGTQPPTVIFSTIYRPGISIGKEQNLERDIDTKNAKKRGADITRRMTGGRSVWLDQDHYIVSLIRPKSPNDLDTAKKYADVCSRVIKSIHATTGLELFLKNNNDLMTSQNGHIGGAAQHSSKDSYIVHCYIRKKINLDCVLDVIMLDGRKLQNYKNEFKEFAVSLETEGYYDYEFSKKFRRSFISCFEEDFEEKDLTTFEKIAIEKIAQDYKNPSYIAGTGNEPSRGNCDMFEGSKVRIRELTELAKKGELKFR